MVLLGGDCGAYLFRLSLGANVGLHAYLVDTPWYAVFCGDATVPNSACPGFRCSGRPISARITLFTYLYR